MSAKKTIEINIRELDDFDISSLECVRDTIGDIVAVRAISREDCIAQFGVLPIACTLHSDNPKINLLVVDVVLITRGGVVLGKPIEIETT